MQKFNFTKYIHDLLSTSLVYYVISVQMDKINNISHAQLKLSGQFEDQIEISDFKALLEEQMRLSP